LSGRAAQVFVERVAVLFKPHTAWLAEQARRPRRRGRRFPTPDAGRGGVAGQAAAVVEALSAADRGAAAQFAAAAAASRSAGPHGHISEVDHCIAT
jgi:hypothetical protein